MVNRRFVDQHAANQNVVGRQLRHTGLPATPFTIAGVIGDLAEDGRRRVPVPYVYTCPAAAAWPDPEYVARTTDARAFAADLRQIVHELDPSRAIFGMRPLSDVLDAAARTSRGSTRRCSASFAGAALLLAAIGLYSLFMLIVVGTRSRDRRAARDRRGAAGDDPARHGRRRPAARDRHSCWALG